MSDMRALSDALIESYPEVAGKIPWSTSIVNCASFESATVKLQRDNVAALSQKETEAVNSFRFENDFGEAISEDVLLFLEHALKRQKGQRLVSSVNFVDARFLVTTSNLFEHLFSVVGYTFSQRRKGLFPINLRS